MFNHFEISLVVFMPNVTTDHDITYTIFRCNLKFLCITFSIPKILSFLFTKNTYWTVRYKLLALHWL